MSKLPVISWRDCVKALQNAGFVIVREGGHIVMRRENPPPVRITVIPKHKALKRGTLRGIIRQAGLTVDEFISYLNE